MNDKEKIKKTSWQDHTKSMEEKMGNAIVEMREAGLLGAGNNKRFDGQPIPSEDFVESFLNELTDEERLVCNDCMNDTIARDGPLEQKYREAMVKAMIKAIANMIPLEGKESFLVEMEKKEKKMQFYVWIISLIKPFDRVLFLTDGR